MSQLFELVRDHVEGFDTIAQEWQTADGIKTVNITLARPAAWIERVHEKGVLTALDCLALIFFVLDDWSAEPTREQEVQLVEGWAAELRRAATAGEIQARHPFTLLPLPNVPEGLDWGLLASDADKFVTARGMAWNFGDIAAHIYREVLTDIESKRFPSFLEGATPAQPQAAAPAPVVAECANDAPVDGITTAQVAAIFDGMPYTAENWPRRLSDTKWLEPAQVALGAQGGASSLWNPATLARLIHGKERGTAKQKTLEALNRKFKSKPVLAPWRTAWDEHYDMFNDADGSH